MARNGSGVYSLPANTAAVSGDPISSTKFNTLVQDLESDANVDRPVTAGGTGASTAAGARTNLGLVIGTDILAYDAGLQSIAGLTTAADKMIYTTASDVYAVTDLTSFARTILDDADAATMRGTLGLVIGTNVQAYDAQLADIAGLTPTDGGFIVGDGTNFVVETGATAQASLGYTASDVLTKLLTVDGAGSGLDADTLDGSQASAFATLAGSAFTEPVSIGNTGGGATLTVSRTSQAANLTVTLSGGNTNISNASTNLNLQIAGTTYLGITATLATFSAPILARVAASSETSGTLTAASANKTIIAAGGITLPASVFTAGDMLTIDGGGTARTITRGSGLTMYVNGSDSATATLTANGVMGVWYRSATVCILTGNVS